jgi:hypothetical protein
MNRKNTSKPPPFDVQSILTGLGYETRAYSGRLMFGKECLAIHSDYVQFDLYVMGRVSDLIRDRYGLPITKALNIMAEELGKQHVIYFPDIPYSEPEKTTRPVQETV